MSLIKSKCIQTIFYFFKARCSIAFVVLITSFIMNILYFLPCMSWTAWVLGLVLDMPGNPYWMGRLSTIDLLALTSAFDIANIIYFSTKQGTLMRRPTVMSLLLQLVFPGWTFIMAIFGIGNLLIYLAKWMGRQYFSFEPPGSEISNGR